jgi:hypothetical protein
MSFKDFLVRRIVSDPTRRSHRWTPARAVGAAGGFAAFRRTSTFRLQAFDPSAASLSATSRSEASMIQKPPSSSRSNMGGSEPYGWNRSVV